MEKFCELMGYKEKIITENKQTADLFYRRSPFKIFFIHISSKFIYHHGLMSAFRAGVGGQAEECSR